MSVVCPFEVHSCEIMTWISQCKSLGPTMNLHCSAESQDLLLSDIENFAQLLTAVS